MATNPEPARCISQIDQLLFCPSQTHALRPAWSSPRRCTSAATCQPNFSESAVVTTAVRTSFFTRLALALRRRLWRLLLAFFFPPPSASLPSLPSLPPAALP